MDHAPGSLRDLPDGKPQELNLRRGLLEAFAVSLGVPAAVARAAVAGALAQREAFRWLDYTSPTVSSRADIEALGAMLCAGRCPQGAWFAVGCNVISMLRDPVRAESVAVAEHAVTSLAGKTRAEVFRLLVRANLGA